MIFHYSFPSLKIKALIFYFLYLSLSHSVLACPSGKELESESHLGMVVYSILSEQAFQKYHGPEWVLLDGRTLSADQELSKTMGKIPDGRGVFFRGQNNGRSASEGNPDGHVIIGTYQGDTLQEHTHSVTYGQYTNNLGYPDRAGREAAGPAKETNGIHTGRKSSETRPRNITMNAFIKVKLKCRDAIHDRVNKLEAEIEKKVQGLEASLIKEIGKISSKIITNFNVKDLLNDYIRKQVEDEVQKKIEKSLQVRERGE